MEPWVAPTETKEKTPLKLNEKTQKPGKRHS